MKDIFFMHIIPTVSIQLRLSWIIWYVLHYMLYCYLTWHQPQYKWLATGHMEFKAIFRAWVGRQLITYVMSWTNIFSKCEAMMAVPHQNVARCRDGENVSKLRYEGNECWRVVTLSRNRPPYSWSFSTSWFFHAATSGIRDTIHHPYISTCFLRKHFYTLVSLVFWHARSA